jgi:hypothetical protein
MTILRFQKESSARGRHSAVAVQQPVVLEKRALTASNGFGGECGELIAEVGLREDAEVNPGATQAVQTLTETAFVADATDDEERVLGIGREESPGGFQTGVTGLHHLLRVGQIAADDDVNVRPFRYLQETHGKPPFVVRRVE